MNMIKRLIGLCVVLAMVMLMPVTVLAANTTDVEFTNFFVYDDNGDSIDPLQKTDSSAHYFTYTTGTPATVKIKSYGTTTNTKNGGSNCTYSNGETVTYVACRRNTKYNIHNLVYERGYKWARLVVTTLYTEMGTISGVWSPDSVGTYISARP